MSNVAALVMWVDSTYAKIISKNKVFDGIAKLSKSCSWFYGFKLHKVINEMDDIQGVTFTKGNFDDRKPVPDQTKNLAGCYLETKVTSKKFYIYNYLIKI